VNCITFFVYRQSTEELAEVRRDVDHANVLHDLFCVQDVHRGTG
jgi:hypothetical protein